MTKIDPSEAKRAAARLRIGDFRVDSRRNELARDGKSVRLEPKVIEVLVHLATHAGEVVSREDLLAALWPGVVVGDDALTQAIIKLRRALGDDAHQPSYIETISKRGYRLIAPVEAESPPAAAADGAPQPPRRLAAILSADIAGYSRLMGENDVATMQALKGHQAAVLPLMEKFGGRVIDLAGDGILAEFPSAVGAVECAIDIQRTMTAANAAVPRAQRLEFRIGVNIGDVIHDGGRIYGDGINVAARIQALARPGGIMISQVVLDQVRNRIPQRCASLGTTRLKNIREPVRVYQVALTNGAWLSDHIERCRFALRGRRFVTGLVVASVILAAGAAGVAVLGKNARMPWPLGPDVRGGVTAALPVVAVLPLTNLSGDAKRDYFSDGMTEDIISALGRFSALRVLSRNAVEPLRGPGPIPQSVRDQLGVRYFVKGSVREGDGKLRVAVELSDAREGIVLWSERYEDQGAAVFEIQDRIVRNVATALAIRVSGIERSRSAHHPADRLEAYDLVLRARALTYRMTRDSNREARALLARAIEVAPDYGEAYVTLAHAEYRRADQGWMPDPDEGMRRAEEHARMALTLDDIGSHARAHAQLARVYAYTRNMDQALAEAMSAVQLNPSDPVAQYALGSMLVWLGRAAEGIGPLESVSRFDPTFDNLMLPLAYYTEENYAEALRRADQRLARSPDAAFLHAVRAAALAQLGQEAEAREAVAQIRRLSPFAKRELFATAFTQPKDSARLHEGLRKAGL